MSTRTMAPKKWLNALGALCASNVGEEEASAKVNAYLPLITEDFAPPAFCDASLRAVAGKCEFFPAYARLVELLGAWWTENKPVVPLLNGPEDASLSDTERHIIAAFYRLKDEIIRESRLRNALHWYRLKFPSAYRYLLKNDNDCWQCVFERKDDPAADWSDPGKVLASARKVLESDVKQLDLGRMLAALVHRHAPLNLALLPPEWHPTQEGAR